MTLTELEDMWEQDCIIDVLHLAKSSADVPRLHSKYWRYFNTHKQKAIRLEEEYLTLRGIKNRYYKGEMSRDELIEHGWEQYQGIKPLKTELDRLCDNDADLCVKARKVKANDVILTFLEDVIKSIHSRSYYIKGAIEFTIFQAGGK